MADAGKSSTAEGRYLLGDLSEDERTRIEEAFFADDSKFESLELAEDELIDSYVRNELAPEERQHFKAKVLRSPRLLERVNFATALAEKADSFVPDPEEAAPPAFSSLAGRQKPSWWKGLFAAQPAFGMAMSACVVLILIGGVLLVFGWLRLSNESQQLANERAAVQRQKEELNKQAAAQQAKIDELDAQAQRERDQRAKELKAIEEQRANKLREPTDSRSSNTAFATAILTSTSVRGGSGRKRELVIGPQTTGAKLVVLLNKNEHPFYNAIIMTPEEVGVFRQSKLKPQNTKSGPQLLLIVPAQTLHPGDYTVEVEGVTASGHAEPLADYYSFRVLKKK